MLPKFLLLFSPFRSDGPGWLRAKAAAAKIAASRSPRIMTALGLMMIRYSITYEEKGLIALRLLSLIIQRGRARAGPDHLDSYEGR